MTMLTTMHPGQRRYFSSFINKRRKPYRKKTVHGIIIIIIIIHLPNEAYPRPRIPFHTWIRAIAKVRVCGRLSNDPVTRLLLRRLHDESPRILRQSSPSSSLSLLPWQMKMVFPLVLKIRPWVLPSRPSSNLKWKPLRPFRLRNGIPIGPRLRRLPLRLRMLLQVPSWIPFVTIITR